MDSLAKNISSTKEKKISEIFVNPFSHFVKICSSEYYYFFFVFTKKCLIPLGFCHCLLTVYVTTLRIDLEPFCRTCSLAHFDGNLGPYHVNFLFYLQFNQMKGKIPFVWVPHTTLPRTVSCIHYCCTYQWFVLYCICFVVILLLNVII